jgi:hypothetical protein
MFLNSQSSLVRKAGAAVAVAAVAATFFAGSGSVHAAPIVIQLGDGTPCKDANGNTVPEGTTGKDKHGISYICISGKWEVTPTAITTGDGGPRFPLPRANVSGQLAAR